MIETYKTVKSLENIYGEKFFKLSNDKPTLGHSLKLQKLLHRTIKRINFDFRVVNTLNILPNMVVNSTTLSSFNSNYAN